MTGTPQDHLTPKQLEALELLIGPAQQIMLFGGSRSGKTFLLVWAVIARALKAPNSRHLIVRFRFGHIKSSIAFDTLPKVMRQCYPSVTYELSKTDWYVTLPNGSEIWMGGLDDRERTEKILGNEYATIYLNECSQIPWNSRNMALTRLAQLAKDIEGNILPVRMYADCNPPDKGHWTYKLFKLKVDPENRTSLSDPGNFVSMQLNPKDNTQNLSADYLKTLEGMSARMRKRFLDGEFRDSAPNALFSDEVFDKWRNIDGELPEMLRIVVAVDPSGAEEEDNVDNDEIGIVVAGLGIDGNGYCLADLTCKAGPATWGRVAVQAFVREGADRVVGETNFGGAMVGFVIKTSAKEQKAIVPFRAITASRGKHVRAEPLSSLFETGKFRMAGIFMELEEEACGFTTAGYTGERSPNRIDALVWAAADLFPELMKHDTSKAEVKQVVSVGRPRSWMGNL